MNKKIILGLSLVLVSLFAIVAGSTFAWLTDKGESNTITYNVGKVDYTISLAAKTTDTVVPGDDLTPKFTITNASNVVTNLRVKVEVTSTPVLSDTQLVVTAASGWVKAEDGYYYYGGRDTADDAIAANTAPDTSPFDSVVLSGPYVDNTFADATITFKVTFEVKQDAHVNWDNVGTIVAYTSLAN